MPTTETSAPVLLLSGTPGQVYRSLLTVKQFSERHAAFTQGSMRALIFASKRRHTSRGDIEGNGLDGALVRLGRKVLIDEGAFFEWIEAQRGAR